MAVGVWPVHIDCVPVAVLAAITGLTVICMAAEVSDADPDTTYLRYQLVCVKAPGV